jgi:hypothetical protein
MIKRLDRADAGSDQHHLALVSSEVTKLSSVIHGRLICF